MKFIYMILLISTVFTGCGDKINHKHMLRVGNTVWPGYEPLYLAQHIGILDNNEVRFVEYISTSQVLRAFKNKAVEVAAVTLYDALLLLKDGFNPKIILVLDISNGGDVILSHNEYKNMNSLKGKTIGLENTSMGMHVLSRALEHNDIDINDVKIKRLEAYEHTKEFKNKSVDAIVTYEPISNALIAEYGANEIFSSKEMPNEILDVLIVQDDYLKTHSREIKNLVQSWYKALEYYKNNEKESNAFLSKRLGVGAEEVSELFSGLTLPNRNENLSFFKNGSLKMLGVANSIDKLTHSDSSKNKELFDFDMSKIYDFSEAR